MKTAALKNTSILLSLTLILLVGPALAGGMSRGIALVKRESPVIRNAMINECRDELATIKEDLQRVKVDLDMVSGNIERMKNSDRFVPEKLVDAVSSKKKKIQSLTRLKDKCERLLVQEGAGPDRTMPMSALEKKTFEEKMETSGLSDWLEIIQMDPNFRIETRLPILFSSASATVAKQYHPFLNKLARLLKGYDVRVIVNGYADMDPIKTRKYPSNFELGATRAANVARILMKSGVSPSFVKIGSTGQYRLDPKKAPGRKAFERQVMIAVDFKGKSGSNG